MRLRSLTVLAIAILLPVSALTGCASAPPPEPEPLPYDEPYAEYPGAYDDAEYETEYDPEAGYDDDIFWELGTYGSWIDTHAFGTVWQPRVVDGWQPYYHGHWVWTEWGWTWVSYEPFGWATDHYGNWHFDPVWGWVWIPGYEWFPNRVDWVVYDDYVCWAPLPPPGFEIGDPWATRVDYIWIVVHPDHFIRGDVGRYKMRARHPRQGRASNKIVRKAPAVRYIEKQTKQIIRPAGIKVKTVKKGANEYTKMRLPAAQADKVERYRRSVELKLRKPAEPTDRPRGTRSKQKATTPRKKSKEPAKKGSGKSKSKRNDKSKKTKEKK